jgi:hybrid cluster-associated redox disulfide protein
MEITGDSLMKDIVEFRPEAYEILARFGIKCLACDGILNNTLSECAKHHNLDFDTLLKELKQLEIPRVDKS